MKQPIPEFGRFLEEPPSAYLLMNFSSTDRRVVVCPRHIDNEPYLQYIACEHSKQMKLFTKNIVFTGRVVVILFFMASSGFTTFLHICSMEASECCDTSGASDHHACPNAEEPSPVTGASIQSVNDCHINAVVGGLSAIQALLEKDSKVQNISVLALLIPTFVFLAPSINTSSFISSYSESVSPPSVEKYVLNETFLI